jgi:hypothetical protein
MLVLAVKDALAAPAPMVTLAGTETTPGLLLDRETRAPPLGALPLSVTAPEEDNPPTTGLGLKESEVRVGAPEGGWGVMVSGAVCVEPE